MADPAKGIKELDLSEKHLAYFTFTALNDRNDPQNGEGMQYPEGTTTAQRFNTGGWTFFATSLFASGIGPNLEDRSGLDKGDEDLLTYKGRNGLVYFVKTDADNTGNYRLMPICYAGQDDWSLPEQYRFYASYRLKESYQLPSPAVFSEEGEYSYDAHGTNAIKEQLLAKRGVSIAFHADTSLPGQAADSSKYISENWAHYYGEGGNSCNHIVCIVGWDDSYPKESFVPGNQPPADGAWLVKNSWGADTNEDFAANGNSHWGIRDAEGRFTGYFWLSYYDQSLKAPEAFAFDRSNVGQEFYVEQYDYLPADQIFEVTADTESGMANVFRVEEDSVLSQLSFETATPGTKVTYEIYLLNQGFSGPTEGSPVVSGSQTFPMGGYHKVTLPESQQVEMKNGQLFSVAVKEQTPSGDWAYILPQSYAGNLLAAFGAASSARSVINEKESYFFTDSGWQDLSEQSVLDALLAKVDNFDANELAVLEEFGYTIEPVIDNFPIKAYLEPVGSAVDTGIDPDPARNPEPAYDSNLKLMIGNDVTLFPDTQTGAVAYLSGPAGPEWDRPARLFRWTGSRGNSSRASPIS